MSSSGTSKTMQSKNDDWCSNTWNDTEPSQWAAMVNFIWCKTISISGNGTHETRLSDPRSGSKTPEMTQRKFSELFWDTSNEAEPPKLFAMRHLRWCGHNPVSSNMTPGTTLRHFRLLQLGNWENSGAPQVSCSNMPETIQSRPINEGETSKMTPLHWAALKQLRWCEAMTVRHLQWSWASPLRGRETPGTMLFHFS